MEIVVPRLSFSQQLIHNTVLRPAVQVAVVLWVLATISVFLLANGALPFDRPALAAVPLVAQVLFPSIGMIEIFALMAVVYYLTRRRAIPDLVARAPERARAARETTLLLGYAALGQVGGWIVGPAFGYRPFSFHIAGTVYGCSVPPSVGEVWTWAIYNFVVFAVVPYLWFRQRYSSTQLNLRSTNVRNDLLVIVVVTVIESLVEVGTFPGIFQMSAHQILLAVPLTSGVYAIVLQAILRADLGSFVRSVADYRAAAHS
jgi:hypothetical protein